MNLFQNCFVSLQITFQASTLGSESAQLAVLLVNLLCEDLVLPPLVLQSLLQLATFLLRLVHLRLGESKLMASLAQLRFTLLSPRLESCLKPCNLCISILTFSTQCFSSNLSPSRSHHPLKLLCPDPEPSGKHLLTVAFVHQVLQAKQKVTKPRSGCLT